jgi:MYXO-CTERM domain-containing protein
MKKLMVAALALMVSVAAHAQGSFIFNARDVGAGIDVKFGLPDGTPIGADQGIFNVQLLAGATAGALQPLTPLLALNRTGATAGYPNPLSNVYTVPGVGQGAQALVVIRAFEGASFDAAGVKNEWGPIAHTLQEPPNLPTPLNLNQLNPENGVLRLVPEPTTWALGLLGLGAVLAFRRRK